MTLGMGALRTLTELLPSNFHKTTGLGLSVFSAAGEGSLQWGEQEKAELGYKGLGPPSLSPTPPALQPLHQPRTSQPQHKLGNSLSWF